jgi:hypothetical protein
MRLLFASQAIASQAIASQAEIAHRCLLRLHLAVGDPLDEGCVEPLRIDRAQHCALSLTFFPVVEPVRHGQPTASMLGKTRYKN